jgi:hypothetical protein
MMRQRLQSLMDRVSGRALPTGDTDRYLRARNAHIRIVDEHTQNFFGLRLDSVTEINAFGHHLRLRIKRTDGDTLQLTLSEMPSNKTIFDISATLDQQQDTGKLIYKNVQMTMIFDPPPVESEPSDTL